MNILTSAHPAFGSNFSTIYNAFYEQLGKSTHIDIAVGYVNTDSLSRLIALTNENKRFDLNLTIGMHNFDGFTPTQWNATKRLDNFLRGENRGRILLSTHMQFHGKIYKFTNITTGFSSVMIGSNNLSSIADRTASPFEVATLTHENTVVSKIEELLKTLATFSCETLPEENPHPKEPQHPLEGITGAERVEKEKLNRISQIVASRSHKSFQIQLKTKEDAPKSNLNTYFGKGRENKQTKLILPRPWYEIEIIISKEITTQEGFPTKEYGKFNVITDDGWAFSCATQGDYSKNLRSLDNLEILGRWIKGRLENGGYLAVGDYITRNTLEQYGRHSISLTKIDRNDWFLDFSPIKEK